jgi:hypothetical protein
LVETPHQGIEEVSTMLLLSFFSDTPSMRGEPVERATEVHRVFGPLETWDILNRSRPDLHGCGIVVVPKVLL